jgi:ribosomal protein L30/L7E
MDDVPLPGTEEFLARIRGRAGDMVVVQFRGDSGLNDEQKACLRTLNLKGPRSMSLRWTNDHTTWGLVRSVRDYVGVVYLGAEMYNPQYVEVDENTAIEHVSYGTKTRPGGLVRDEVGHYFAYESDRRALLVFWDSESSIEQAVKALHECFGPREPEHGADASTVGLDVEIGSVPEKVDAYRSEGVTIADGPTESILKLIRDQPDDVNFARLSFRGLVLTWRAPFQRFEDRDRESAEVGLRSPNLDLVAARRMADMTGSRLIQDVALSVQVRQYGNLKTLPF